MRRVCSTRFLFRSCNYVMAFTLMILSFVYFSRSTRPMTPSDASVAEVRRSSQEEKSSLHPPIRGLATRIYLRKEGTGVEHTETRGLEPQEELRHTPLFRMVISRPYLLCSSFVDSITLPPKRDRSIHRYFSLYITRRHRSYRGCQI